MKLLYSCPTEKFPEPRDLNNNPEYPYYPDGGIWLSSIIESTPNQGRICMLSEGSKLFHFRSLSDYIHAYGTFPLFMKNHDYFYKQYMDKSEHFTNEIAKWMDIYHRFSTWKKELYIESGILDTSMSSNVIKEPLHFTDADNTIVKLQVVFDKDGVPDFQETHLGRITGYVRSKKSYNKKEAILLLKQICDYIIRYIKKMSKIISPSPDDNIIGLDYNAMRSVGYKGIYIHSSVIDEALSIKEDSPIYRIINPLLYWSPETVCIWDYCFEE